MPRPWYVPVRSVVRRLARRVPIEVILAVALAFLALGLDGANHQPWQVILLDLTVCAVVALTPLQPQLAGIALWLVLAVYIVLPAGWGTMGEYAPLIAILGAAMRGHWRTGALMTACYFPLLAVIAWGDAPSPEYAPTAWVAWAWLIVLAWVLGGVFHMAVRAQERARVAELLLQRHTLATDLHDTVARSLRDVIMAIERANLRGEASLVDLEAVAAAAEVSLDQLRVVMNILKDAPANEPIASIQRTPLTEALEAGVSRLEGLGFSVSAGLHGDISVISESDAVILGAAAQEAIANLGKYADPAQDCMIIADATPEAVSLVFVNGWSEASQPSDGHEGLGLWGVEDRLRRAGGRVLAERVADRWVTSIWLPRSADPSEEESK